MAEIFIRLTPECAVSNVPCLGTPDLDFFYEEIGTHSIEIVRFGHLKQCLIVDECGRLRESPQINPIASLLAGQPICGTVLIAKEGERNGEPAIIGFTEKEVIAARLGLHFALMSSGLFTDFKEADEAEES